MRPHSWIVLGLILLGLVARLCVQGHYGPLEWPDAVPHGNYILFVYYHETIPTSATPLRQDDPTNDYENIQAPLYYILAAGVLASSLAMSASGLEGVRNVRWFSVALWLAGCVLFWRACARFLIGGIGQVTAVGFYCLLPGWIWISCAVSNDALLVFLACLLLWVLSRTTISIWAVTLVCVAAIATKFSGALLVVLPVVLFVYRREWWGAAAVAGSSAVALGLLIWRNLVCFGDMTGQGAVAPVYDRPFLHIIKRHVQGFVLAWNQDRVLNYEWYLLWPSIVTGIAILVWFCPRILRSRAVARQRVAALTSGVVLVLAVAANLIHATTDGVAPGRLSYVALPALCFYIAAGIAANTQKRTP